MIRRSDRHQLSNNFFTADLDGDLVEAKDSGKSHSRIKYRENGLLCILRCPQHHSYQDIVKGWLRMKIPNSLRQAVAKLSNVKHLHCEVDERLYPKLDPTGRIDKAANAKSREAVSIAPEERAPAASRSHAR
jgi:hypothetical protein